MFVRYIWLLLEFGSKKLFFVSLLCFLFRSTFRTVIGNKLSVEALPSKSALKIPSTAYHIPLLSLPNIFSTNESSIPCSLPYLEPSTVMDQRFKVDSAAGGLSIGIVWASDPSNTKMYRHKSITLEGLMNLLHPLLELDLSDIHSLQVGADSSALDPWAFHPRIYDWSSQLTTFEETAHVVRQLDLIISVDTAVAHLSAGLARPTWILLPANPDFRWLLERKDSPWYPNFLVFFVNLIQVTGIQFFGNYGKL